MTDLEQGRGKRWFRRTAITVALGVALVGAGALLWASWLGPRIDAIPPRRIIYVAAATLAVALLAMYAWRRTSLWRLARAARLERQAALEAAGRVSDQLVAKAVDLAGVTLEWAIRAELVRDDVRDVEEYMLQLAKRSSVSRVIVAGRDGVIIAATDPTLSGQRLEGAVAGLPPDGIDSQVQYPTGRILRQIVPIMGLDTRVGTLVLEYDRGTSLNELPGEQVPRALRA